MDFVVLEQAAPGMIWKALSQMHSLLMAEATLLSFHSDVNLFLHVTFAI